MRRKHLIQQARIRARRFGLVEELDGFVYAAGCEAITGLDLHELEALTTWIDDLAARAELQCDAQDSPPAR